VRAAAGDGLALEVTDPALRRLQRDIDALHVSEAAASAAAVGEQLRAVNSDPELARLGREIDRVLKLDTPHAAPPSKPWYGSSAVSPLSLVICHLSFAICRMTNDE
jgi:hypothetical protein